MYRQLEWTFVKQKSIAELGKQIRLFLGERDFDDATTIEEYVEPVDLHPDGSITDEHGNTYPNPCW